MENRANILIDYDTNEVYVLNNYGKEVFRKPKSKQIIKVAHDIYMGYKYKE